ncbi:hypothetical protein OG571_47315 (plasmid) [Streptomyces sp. NBC_01369]|uniref:hypothetical protein n=1 Tax=Streptomyces sp. NBC_01369 TaxID=2903842 RepID=UPI002F918B86
MTVPGPLVRLTSDSSDPSAMVAARMAISGPRHGQTALYRSFDAEGQLLYAGISGRLPVRWREHSRDYATRWWPEVRSNTVEWFLTRVEAERAEREAIRTEEPLHNILHTSRSRVPQGQRECREILSSKRGDALMEILKTHFTGRPFTAADVVDVAGASSSGVYKNISALAARGEVVVVGSRHVVNKTPPYRLDSMLYMLPVQQWVDGETGAPLTEVPEVRPQVRRKILPRNLVPKQPSRSSTAPAPPGDPLLPVPLPSVVTFASGAELLAQMGIVKSITREGVRRISNKSADWPFGPGKEHSYGKAGTAQTMDTKVFLAWFRKNPPRGRGPARKKVETASSPSPTSPRSVILRTAGVTA